MTNRSLDLLVLHSLTSFEKQEVSGRRVCVKFREHGIRMELESNLEAGLYVWNFTYTTSFGGGEVAQELGVST